LNPRRVAHQLIDGPAGRIEVAILAPDDRPPRGVALVAHPHPLHGGTMDNKVVQTLAKTFQRLGYAAVRFNFRGVGGSEGRHDEGVGETDDAMVVLAYAQRAFGELPVALAGFSFGSFVQTRVARRLAAERLVLVGPAVGRFRLEPVPADTIVVHGEEDEVVALADVFAWARPQALPIIVFPGCGHFFHGRLGQLQQVVAGAWKP